MTVSLIIPTLNEAGSIEAVLKEIPRDVGRRGPHRRRRLHRRHAGARPPAGRPRHPAGGRGYGAAIATGFRHVRGDIIVLADADGSYNLDDIRRLVHRVQDGADLALGSRYLPESGSEDDTLVRYVGNKVFTWTVRKLYGVELTDVLFFYAAMRREVIESITATSPASSTSSSSSSRPSGAASSSPRFRRRRRRARRASRRSTRWWTGCACCGS